MDATTRSFNLDPETFEYLNKIEHSIGHWSRELGLAALRVRGLEGQLAGIYESREGLIKQALEKAGFKPDKATRIQISGDGKVNFIELPEEPIIPTE